MAERRRIIMGAVAVVVLCGSAYFALSEIRPNTPGSIANARVFKCADCNAEFKQTLTLDNPEPVACPECGHKAGWSPEKCLCTGEDSPTYVIVKSRMGIEEETRCPKCDREVVPHNVLVNWKDEKTADREGRDRKKASQNNTSFD